MEPRSMRIALLAGRAASRWASSTPTTVSRPFLIASTCAANASRYFSSSRLTRQEAEASAPYAGGMSYFMDQHKAQQQETKKQQQQQQQQPQGSLAPPAQQSIDKAYSNNLFAPPNSMTTPWRKSNSVIPSSSSTTQQVLDLVSDDIAPRDTRLELEYLENPSKRKLRLRPVIGRTIDFASTKDHRSKDLASGLSRLAVAVRVNNVRGDSMRQRFHERPGLKRKRQKSERWVKRFKVGFQATCKRVSQLAKQGW